MGWITEYDLNGNPVNTYGDPYECGAYSDEIARRERILATRVMCPGWLHLEARREEAEREALYAPTGEKQP